MSKRNLTNVGRPRGDDPEGPLRMALKEARAEHKCSMDDLTVLAINNDPFRMDTGARHRDARWFAELIGERTIHNRGAHYIAFGKTMPDGKTYTSTSECYDWIEKASRAARWLGYVPFDQITDERNDAPILQVRDKYEPWGSTFLDEVDINLRPRPHIFGWEAIRFQPYRIALAGEKTSLEPVLSPLSEKYNTDLCLPTGEMSDTMIYHIAKAAHNDGRRLIVLYFSDCDPGGHEMPANVGWKLRALQALHFPHLEFEVYHAALTVKQVKNAEAAWGFGLPSSPLKEGEKRKGKWWDAYHIEQTEIDSLATLHPDILSQIAEDAIAPWYDATLDRQMRKIHREWRAEAQAALDANDDLTLWIEEADAKVHELQEIRAEIVSEVEHTALPEAPDVPEPDTDGDTDSPLLIDSDDDLYNQVRVLKSHKNYELER